MRILIVEDNRGVRRLLRQTVAQLTTDIRECVDGADALTVYTEHRPDLVLMDIRMPRMDGLEATRQIRQFHSAARIVMVTDYDDEELRNAAHAAGACGYALKQNLTELLLLIDTAMAA
jgi:two-component system response regulator DegU